MRRFALVLLLPLLFACDEDATQASAKSADTVVRAGTSFGFCLGYCTDELVIADGAVTYTRRDGRDPAHPDLVYTARLDATEWEALRLAADPALLDDTPEVVGCPDCADGGSEWVRLAQRGSADAVTFEYGDDLEALGELLPQLRELRQRFREESGF